MAVSAVSAEPPHREPPRVEPLYTATYTAPYAGHYNHAHVAPTFRWGWFGAERFHPRVQWHRDYNGELMRWSTHSRY